MTFPMPNKKKIKKKKAKNKIYYIKQDAKIKLACTLSQCL